MPLSPRTLRPANNFTPRSITGLALWLDASDGQSLWTTDAGAVTAVSSPTDIAGCVGWWDASDAASITASGGLVSQWNDKSGNNRHATASGSLRPTSGGSQNGRTVMQFTGTQAMTITGNFLQSDNVTMFAVAMKNTDHYGGIISSAPTNPEDSPLLGFYSTTLAFVNRRQVVQQAVSNGVYRIIAAQSVGTTQQGWFDGVKTTDSVASVATNTSNTITKIGAFRTSSTADLNGNIAEIVCYSGNLSATDRARVEAYLAAKWGISGVHAQATATSDPVGAWLDKSGNARHATQSTAGSRPTISATALNGKKQLGLISQHLRGPSTTWTGSASIYWVGRTGQSANGAFVFGDGTTDQTDGFHAGWLNTAGVGAYGNGWQSGNAPRAESPSAWRNADVVAGVTLSSTEAIARVNGATTNTTAALTGSLSQSAAAQFYIGRESSGTWNNINGSLAELLIYQPALNASQRLRLERYLAAKYGITLAPTVSNADAQDWISRVYANGGTVSSSTAAAVSTFCDAIDAASIRDRFYRLNLFCGGTSGTTAGLAACLVPLYRGPSLGGTQYGNATDTNTGPFAVGDYAETGASGGLTGNGTSKYLNTGLKADAVGQTDRHLACSIDASTFNNTSKYIIGVDNFGCGGNAFWGIMTGGSSLSQAMIRAHNTSSNSTSFNVSGRQRIVLSGNGSASAYLNGTLAVTGPSGAFTAPSIDIYTHALNRCGSVGDYTSVRISSYSVGLAMTAAQVASYESAMSAFQTALGRA